MTSHSIPPSLHTALHRCCCQDKFTNRASDGVVKVLGISPSRTLTKYVSNSQWNVIGDWLTPMENTNTRLALRNCWPSGFSSDDWRQQRCCSDSWAVSVLSSWTRSVDIKHNELDKVDAKRFLIHFGTFRRELGREQ